MEKQACTCPAVLNFLARYASHWEAIGKELIGQDQVRKIKSDGWAEGDEAAYVVEEWWSSTTDEVEFSWKKLKEAIDKTMEVRDQSNKPQQTSEGKCCLCLHQLAGMDLRKLIKIFCLSDTKGVLFDYL